MTSPLKKVLDFFTHGIWELDTSDMGKPGVFAVSSLRLIHASVRLFTEGQLSMRAMSLVYTTLMSIVPVIAVSFSLLKAFGVHNQAAPVLLKFLAPLGEKAPEITQKVLEFVSNMKVGVLGSVGLALLLYTVISVISKIEESFNYIWKITSSRSLARRFSNYISVIMVAPILVFSAIGLTATVMSSTVVQRLIEFGRLGVVVYIAGKFLPYVITCAAFTFMYIFIPSVKVKLRPALVGGAFAGILWELSGWAFAKFVVASSNYSAIYSGFAIIIMFNIWIYISWLILLVGCAVAFYHQFPQYLVMKEGTLRLSNRMSERLAFTIMYLIGRSYHESGPAWTLSGIIARLGLPVEPVSDTLGQLEKTGLIVQTSDDPPRYMPARDMETIKLAEVLDCARTAHEETCAVRIGSLSPPAVEELSVKMGSALYGPLDGLTLKDLVTSKSAIEPQ